MPHPTLKRRHSETESDEVQDGVEIDQSIHSNAEFAARLDSVLRACKFQSADRLRLISRLNDIPSNALNKLQNLLPADLDVESDSFASSVSTIFSFLIEQIESLHDENSELRRTVEQLRKEVGDLKKEVQDLKKEARVVNAGFQFVQQLVLSQKLGTLCSDFRKFLISPDDGFVFMLSDHSNDDAFRHRVHKQIQSNHELIKKHSAINVPLFDTHKLLERLDSAVRKLAQKLVDCLESPDVWLENSRMLQNAKAEKKDNQALLGVIMDQVFAYSVIEAFGYTEDEIAVLIRMNVLRRQSGFGRHHPYTHNTADRSLCIDLFASVVAFLQKENNNNLDSSLQSFVTKTLRHNNLAKTEEDIRQFFRRVEAKLLSIDQELFTAQ